MNLYMFKKKTYIYIYIYIYSARNKVLPKSENATLWKQIVQWTAPNKVVMTDSSKCFRIATPNMKNTGRQL